MGTYTFFWHGNYDVYYIFLWNMCNIFLWNMLSSSAILHLGLRQPHRIWVPGHQVAFGSEVTKSHLGQRLPNRIWEQGHQITCRSEARKPHLGQRPQNRIWDQGHKSLWVRGHKIAFCEFGIGLVHVAWFSNNFQPFQKYKIG